MRTLLVCLLAFAPALAEELEPVTLPVASKGEPDKGDQPDDRIIVTLDRHGRVLFQGQSKTLDELGAILTKARERYHLKMKGLRGKSGFDTFPGGARASKLFVLLRADKDAPWLHVQWILVILAEQKLYKLQFAVKRVADGAYRPDEAKVLGAEHKDSAPPKEPRLEAKLKAFLPVDRGLAPIPEESVAEIRISVRIMGRKAEPRKWGPPGAVQRASIPTDVLYRYGDRKAGHLEPVGEYIRDLRKTALDFEKDAKVIGDVRALHTVPFKYVVALLNLFRTAGLKDVEFFGPSVDTSIPDAAVRKLKSLPYPTRNG